MPVKWYSNIVNRYWKSHISFPFYPKSECLFNTQQLCIFLFLFFNVQQSSPLPLLLCSHLEINRWLGNIKSIIYSDGWAAYNGLGALGLNKGVVTHADNFLDPSTGVHADGVEAYWSRAKRKLKAVSSHDICGIEATGKVGSERLTCGSVSSC